MLFKTSGLIIALTLGGGALAAQETVTMADCDKLSPNKGSDLRKAMACVGLYKNKLDDIEARLKTIEQNASVNGASLVVASMIPCNELTGNWVEFLPARGRFLAGAGDTGNPELRSYTPFASRTLEGWRAFEGGNESFLISEGNLPKHKHEVVWNDHHSISLNADTKDVDGDNQYLLEWHGAYNRGRANNNMDTTTFGEDVPKEIELIPPYLAVHFCTGDGSPPLTTQ
ncbi:hypothetical protein TRP8649_04462 [Pelagimonas phthalicica]|uniref:Uncharacterized protein n=1 Tax=Pelagimonas phthalicica TaxID=1037362 RepID=A0A238JI24_9RHOB|nr:hypothetical protein [Pelagimonas phthalicica]TDS90151.1 hypothetical protein CLV87_4208 [Pelagimonas phthalicica]SMX30319.1 hypothetical protein TRP8649_04462 [Pelagimonas phthalicica]